MAILFSQNKRISQSSDFLCEAMDLLNNPHTVWDSPISVLSKFHTLQWWIQDGPAGGSWPHRGGLQSWGGYVLKILYVKMKESGTLGACPLDLAMLWAVVCNTFTGWWNGFLHKGIRQGTLQWRQK